MARRFRPARAAAGFTLLEVLVVVTVVAILAGLLAGSLRPDPGRGVEEEGWRLARLAEGLAREAELTGEVLALRWDAGGYAFLRRQDDGQWAPLPPDGVFAPRRLPDGWRLDGAGEVVFAPGLDIAPRQLNLSGAGTVVEIRLSTLGEANARRQGTAGQDDGTT